MRLFFVNHLGTLTYYKSIEEDARKETDYTGREKP